MNKEQWVFNAEAQRMNGYGLCVMVYRINNGQNALTP